MRDNRRDIEGPDILVRTTAHFDRLDPAAAWYAAPGSFCPSTASTSRSVSGNQCCPWQRLQHRFLVSLPPSFDLVAVQSAVVRDYKFPRNRSRFRHLEFREAASLRLS